MARTSTPDKMLGEWFWTDRWMGSSGFLLPMEPRGLYREMLTQAWRRAARVGRPELPTDHETIQRATGCTGAEWKRCWPLVAPHWRVEGAYLVNDTQLQVYAACRARVEAESNRGKKGAQARAQAVAQARAQAATQVGAQACTQAPAQEAPECVLVGYPPDPDPDRELSTEQESSRRVRARAFMGQRLKVSERQHELAEDASGSRAAGVDLTELYPHWDADLVASREPFDVLVYVKRRACEAVQQKQRTLPVAPDVDWLEECQQLHKGTCGGRVKHHSQMLIDRGRQAVTA
jgi:hypothetical protein